MDRRSRSILEGGVQVWGDLLSADEDNGGEWMDGWMVRWMDG